MNKPLIQYEQQLWVSIIDVLDDHLKCQLTVELSSELMTQLWGKLTTSEYGLEII
jgi:hypothetical protein